MTTAAELLAAYHEQVRDVLPSKQPEGVVVDSDGPLVRVSGGKHHGYVVYRDLAGATGAELDALIERTRDYFSSRNEAFEWKTHSYDEPADLPDRLTSAGFVAGEVETVVIGLAEELTGEPELPAGVSIRQVSEPVDFERIAALHTEIWNEDWGWLAADLADRQAAYPDDIAIFVAEAGSQLITPAWLVRDPGSEFATLWGGAHPARLARAGHLPGDGGPAGPVRHPDGRPLPAGRRLGRQRADPATAGVCGGHHHDALPVDATRWSGLGPSRLSG